jgi:hypothetical protein
MNAEFGSNEGSNMRATNWLDWTDDRTAARRSGGRRAYNKWRATLASLRFNSVVEAWIKLIKERGRFAFHRGYQSEIARRLGLHRSIVSRDLKKLRMMERGYSWEEVKLISKIWHRSVLEMESYFCERFTIDEWRRRAEPYGVSYIV